ncbi:GvpL/GvpF family gas vesicle protein [Streptomyces sp. ISL-36]|uniref:GvpL/GvpF family gas vesicle protein n=1 Tax=Streptomyces sp. ISL-36 TaxID=2819182 RepID=UPI001BEC185A|nr:GvpL/GvpF family gas vesicle protein [Streptomyces sp. ISL-36]MBT2442950.1 GvpL/GvpF family gas vesicle protein [Streptomyces sp. ISL-36]
MSTYERTPRETPGFAGTGPELTYVYAVGRDDGALRRPLGRLTGVHGHDLRLIRGDGLVAPVSSVPSDVFGERALRALLEDLPALEAMARAHHAVVDAAFAETVVLPLRLATVYRDDSRVVAMLAEQRRRFEELLAELDGNVELGVKVYVDPNAARSREEPPPPEASAAPSGPGRAYLAQRRARRRSTQDLYRTAGAIAAEATAVARAFARAGVAHRPQQGELSHRPGENLSNEAYLVAAGDAERFREQVGALAGRAPGVHIEVTGPWAPYSFATPDMAGDEGAP